MDLYINVDHLPGFDPIGLQLYCPDEAFSGLCLGYNAPAEGRSREVTYYRVGRSINALMYSGGAPWYVSLAESRSRDALLRYLALRLGWAPLLDISGPEWFWDVDEEAWGMAAMREGDHIWGYADLTPNSHGRLADGSLIAGVLAFKRALMSSVGRDEDARPMIRVEVEQSAVVGQLPPRRALPTLTPDELDEE